MTRGLALILLAASLLAGPSPVHAEDEPEAAETAPEVDPKKRDEAIRQGMACLDEAIWKLPEHGSTYKPYAAAVAAWAYLISADRVKEGRRLPSRRRALRKVHDASATSTSLA